MQLRQLADGVFKLLSHLNSRFSDVIGPPYIIDLLTVAFVYISSVVRFDWVSCIKILFPPSLQASCSILT